MSIVEHLASRAIRLGADALEVEYKDGYEEVCAAKGGVGYGIARFRSSSREAASLRKELLNIAKTRQRLSLDNYEYELRGRVYDSFGEDAFRVELRLVEKPAREGRRDT
jgi:predicted amino acid dehydrogenase